MTDINKPIFSLFPEKVDRILNGLCVTCDDEISLQALTQMNVISRKEYGISGMCQVCQDSVFSEPEEEDDLTYEGW
tara:strand:- start:81 stop:308 length:228 start_codon:yes stop_codon:yes gene_type:complete